MQNYLALCRFPGGRLKLQFSIPVSATRAAAAKVVESFYIVKPANVSPACC